MKKLYTKLQDIYVLNDPGDLSGLRLDSCVVAKRKGQLYVQSLECLTGKEVETGSDRWDSIFRIYSDGEKAEKSLVLGGESRSAKFCDLCKDKLNGITANCFDRNIKSKGCSFVPLKKPAEFNIDLNGWKYLAPTDANRYSPFRKPFSAEYIGLDAKTIARNKNARKVRANFRECLENKEEKYCSRCIFNGLCYMNSTKIAEHCKVLTEEKTIERCLQRIQKRFGNIEEFLQLLAYSGQEIVHRPLKASRKSRWLVSRPFGRNHFLVRKAYGPFKMTKVSRRKVEKALTPETVPLENRERIAALSWFFIEKYCLNGRGFYRGYRGRTIRVLSVLPVTGGIEVMYYPYGWQLSRQTKIFRSFNDILRFER
ncbi:MAG: hypothetical protein A3G33_08370 [Omnitrophica bacterium RIFCSPLOWO2_12_FULL_44_17]|uniref:Uncharacterized protein n=1 Tax=Candidatus Danuiimicrobium aquiferis TaxID=1801832 RepID=A0A1G1KX54_9BACT|nr:MAG: hypothetical protein A3B72_03590 [Omnitrophica bacterium RIFCSPHIGHO2_02_FULL_45_28]OGW90539.1 MAG: hypothetical protein A3E74_03110 [Omnitrophica bacterium RIFCSPHIGHO2_12_FULL_44_12]OGW97179.1 MAG: hypothetical protein A3G33_08370 [Omnitrophica bacterium RIFCSPLOWO2_12_FULL_44_17]